MLVTGGAGFIGSALVWALNRHGIDDILVVDRLGSDEKWRNLVPLAYADYMDADELLERMRGDARVLRVQMPDAARVRLLLEDYGFFARDPARFCALLEALVELQGHATVSRWQAMAGAGQWAAVFGELMLRHYDPLYERSMRSHFAALADAPTVDIDDGSPEAMRDAARRLTTAA